MTSRTRRVLLSLVFAPWVSAAPAMQRSELLLVESPPASCNVDLSTIQHELCAIVHDVAKIVEDIAALNTPHIIYLSEYSCKGEIFTASAVHLHTTSDIPITARSPLHACDQEPLESWKVALSDDDRQKGHNLVEELSMGKIQWKRDGDADTVNDIFENGESESNDRLRHEGSHNVDIRGDEETVNEAILLMARLFYVRLWVLPRSYQKPNRFRVSETILLRWAREDMIFDDEEEDTMVNGGGEEIPLKPSPRKNFVIQYGSCFLENGVVVTQTRIWECRQ
ncbi:hypothetical protein BD769DRAFT_1636914 [Suillus cothurnatus]|nr:hypothetical protein BD769DRAFT_1636914 [Suillus cothurnatus]